MQMQLQQPQQKINKFMPKLTSSSSSMARRSHSYSSGLSSISSNKDEDAFQPLSLQKSIDILPIPPTAPNKPMGLSQFNRSNRNKSRSVTNTSRSAHVNNDVMAANGQFDIGAHEYSGSFFDNVAIRSHSYTSLSRLQKLAELTEQQSSNGRLSNLNENENGNGNGHRQVDKE